MACRWPHSFKGRNLCRPINTWGEGVPAGSKGSKGAEPLLYPDRPDVSITRCLAARLGSKSACRDLGLTCTTALCPQPFGKAGGIVNNFVTYFKACSHHRYRNCCHKLHNFPSLIIMLCFGSLAFPSPLHTSV